MATSPLAVPAVENSQASVRRTSNVAVHVCLFLLTCVTTTLTGMRAMENFRAGREPLTSLDDMLPLHWMWAHRMDLRSGLPFSLTLLGILLAHEFGHYFAARVFRVDVSLPYVLPGPSVTGTLGAVIRLRGVVRSRKALMVIAASGPICGFLVALLTTTLGLVWSVPMAKEPAWLVRLHEPLLMMGIKTALAGGLGIVRSGPLLWHPVLLASWFGLLITSLNLMPAGQLDGGHILYVLSERAHKMTTRVATAGLFLLGIFVWAPWFLWAGLLLIPAMRKPYVVNRRRGFVFVPPGLDRRAPTGRKYKLLGLVCLVIAMFCALPKPCADGSLLNVLNIHLR